MIKEISLALKKARQAIEEDYSQANKICQSLELARRLNLKTTVLRNQTQTKKILRNLISRKDHLQQIT
jgi:hypothetical protein